MMASLFAIILVSAASAASMAAPGVTRSGLSRCGSLMMTKRSVIDRDIDSKENNEDIAIRIIISLNFIVMPVICIYRAKSFLITLS